MDELAYNYPPELPICAFKDEILKTVAGHPVTVICGDTGSGKTTQIPKMLMELGYGAKGRRIACTQPRRLAAVTVATRVAQEMHTPVGGLVGFRHRFGRQVCDATRLVFMTDGVLLAETRTDPLLRRYDAIIIDEAHERSLNVDFLLGILKRILARRRDLKVVVSSATLDTGHFAAFFNNAPAVIVPGRLYPIDILYRPPPPDAERDLPREVARALAELPPSADTLVFLPGERDIRETAEHLRSTCGDADEIIPLLASLPAADQQRAFRLSSRRRVILATNVAETSVTIPGIRAVIDSGLARISRFVPRTQVQRLQIESISQASARQRAGRCGRLGPGTCIRLYSEEDFATRDPYTPPEVLRSSLASVILTLLDLRLGDILQFPFLDPPKSAAAREGLRELLELGAVCEGPDAEPVLTSVGRQLAQIPVEPRLARILLAAADNGALPDALPLVAALSCDDPRRRPVDEREKATQAHAPFRVPGSDFLGTLRLWTWWEDATRALSQSKARALAKKTYLSYPKLREWRDLTHQLTRLCERLHLSFLVPALPPPPKKPVLFDERAVRLHRALLSGLLGRIGRYDPEERDYRGAYGLRFALHPGSVVGRKGCPEWIFAGELVDTARLFARHAAVLDPAWIEPVAGPLCRHSYHSPDYDPASGFVRATEQVTLHGLVIVPARRCDFSRIDPVLAREIFIRRALVDGEFPRPPPEVRSNTAFLNVLRRRAERARRPDYFDAEKLFSHFDAAVPPDVCSADALRKWLRNPKTSPSARAAFALDPAAWLPPADAPDADFPATLRIGTATLHLSYRHAPDDPDSDGITCTVAKRDAPALRLWRADWLVPGALPEKLAWMIATLPKAVRRALPSTDDTLAALRARLHPGSSPLREAVCAAIDAEWGFRVPPDAWDSAREPVHFRVRYRIRDDATGRILATSRDLDDVLAAAGLSPRAAPVVAATLPAAWDLRTPVKGPIPAYAALQANADGTVAISLHPDPAAAARVHAAGLTRLFQTALGKSQSLPKRKYPLPVALYLREIDYPADRIASDLFAGAIKETFIRHREPIRDSETFARALESGTMALAEAKGRLITFFDEIVTTAADLSDLLAQADERLPSETAAEVRTQLAWLVFPGFVANVPAARLAHYARYLKGIRLRLERARNSPSSDRTKAERFNPWWQLFREAMTGKDRASYDPEALQEFRWLLEEYRISVFAQELRTAEPVSPKRLETQWSRVTTPPTTHSMV